MKRKVEELGGRRSFFRKLGAAAAGLGAASVLPDATLEGAVQVVNKSSMPSQLKITDLRVAVVTGAPFTCPIIRIDTNQGLSGYGEVRDGASKTYALMLKSRLLGENPCSVDKVFRKIKQFGHAARQAGGVCGVEMAGWALGGKACGVPVYQMLGGRFRDRVRLYADTTEVEDGHAQGRRLKERMDHGLTFLKVDFGVNLLKDKPGMLNVPAAPPAEGRDMVMHPFTGMAITDKGIAYLSDFVGAIREEIGMEVPLASDHYGPIDVNSCIRLARATEKHQLAWMEDMVPWQLPHLLKQIKDAVDIPILTGEDIYLKEDFARLITAGAVDIIHPDLASAGGLLEMKKISDFAMEHGVPMAMHFAGTPVSFMANLHTAVAVENFLVLENHSVDVPWRQDLVSGVPKPILDHGFAAPSDQPGLGVVLVEEVVKAHLKPGTTYFAPTPEWDNERSWDRLWS